MSPRLAIDRAAIADFCQRHHVRRLALFGSVLRDDFGSQSDVDVLVEFEPGHVAESQRASWATSSPSSSEARKRKRPGLPGVP
jgi:predicted nucleotidyltransferase